MLATALAIDPISRSLRDAAMRRRRAVMRRFAGAVPGSYLVAGAGWVSVGMCWDDSIALGTGLAGLADFDRLGVSSVAEMGTACSSQVLRA